MNGSYRGTLSRRESVFVAGPIAPQETKHGLFVHHGGWAVLADGQVPLDGRAGKLYAAIRICVPLHATPVGVLCVPLLLCVANSS